MRRLLVISQPALRDVERIVDYYEGQESGLGQRFRVELDNELNHVVSNPFAYQTVYRGIRRAVVRRFVNTIYFRTSTSRVEVLAIWDDRRDPQEIRARLG